MRYFGSKERIDYCARQDFVIIKTAIRDFKSFRSEPLLSPKRDREIMYKTKNPRKCEHTALGTKNRVS